MPALLFGSISTLADTSEEQRAAFNEAFEKHGVDWRWERDEYRQLLTSNGGRRPHRRVRPAPQTRTSTPRPSTARSPRSSSTSWHAVPLRPRPGVAESIEAARAKGWQVASGHHHLAGERLRPARRPRRPTSPRDAFDVIVDATTVDEPKPSPAAYRFALDKLGVDAGDCIAVEDNVGGAASAGEAGIACVAFPNENTVEHDFGALPVSHHLEFVELEAAVAGR